MTLALIAATLASAPGAPLASREVDEEEGEKPSPSALTMSPASLERMARAEEKRRRRAEKRGSNR